MPRIREHYLDALDLFSERVSHAGLTYVRRAERFEALADYGLRAIRELRLRSTSKKPVECIETAWVSEVPAPFAKVGFELAVSPPRKGLALPVVDRLAPSDDMTPVKEVRVVLSFTPPIQKGELVDLRMTWTWPCYWSLLEKLGKDSLELESQCEAEELSVTLCTHRSLPSPIYVSTNATPIATEPVDEPDLTGHRWTFKQQASGSRLRFNLSSATNNGGASKPSTLADLRTKVFISYAREDEPWMERLRVHLRGIPAIQESVDIWSDADIEPGQKWAEEIENALQTARLAILLVSPSFLVSEFITTKELPNILARAGSDLIVLPLLVRDCTLQEQPFLNQYQFLNKPREPLAALKSAKRDAVLAKVASTIATKLKRS